MSQEWRRALLMTSALVPLTFAAAAAGPNGATVVGGSAAVQGQGTPNVVVNQTSQSAIINWNTFNIGAGETTRINMPSASSVELDRVTGGLGPSQILGSLSSNGRVFLVNPDGILFGSGSRINVGGLLATTHDISNADFMAGRYNFSISGNLSASIVNQGSITAQTGGFAALVAPGVRNTGTITATLGTIALASGNEFTLDLYGDRLIKLGVNDSIASQVIDVSTGKPLSSLVSNEGTLKANGGKVELTAVAARRVVDFVIRNTGVIEANTIGSHNGMIVLGAATRAKKPSGAPTQTVKVSGTLSAAGNSKGTTGGTIVLTGEDIQVSGATINASGSSGGGAILIGGDWGGGHPNTSLVSNASAYLEPYTIPTASTVSIDPTTTINASAMTAGNGGKVVVWSNESTAFYGAILAKGGAQSGNGGFVETSGHELAFNGEVNLAAPNGAAGTWLLDPQDVTIASSGVGVVTPTAIETALASGNVLVTTSISGTQPGDITVADNIAWAGDNSLTLIAARNITINNGVTIANTGAGNLNLFADYAGTYNGTYNGTAPTGVTGANTGTVNFVGSGKVDFSQSTGFVEIFYYPPSGYANPIDYSSNVLINPSSIPHQFNTYLLINNLTDQQNAINANNVSNDYWVTIYGPTAFPPFATTFTPTPAGSSQAVTPTPVTMPTLPPPQNQINPTQPSPTPGGGAPIPLPGPNDVLTWPAIGGIVQAAIAPLLNLMPADLASAFQNDVQTKLEEALANNTLTIKTGGLNVVGTVLSGVVGFYIDQLTDRAMSNCGGTILCAIQIGSGEYALQVISNTIIDYVTTPELWPTGLSGVAVAGSAGIIQSTIGELVGLAQAALGL